MGDAVARVSALPYLRAFSSPAVGRWLVVGAGFYFIGLAGLFLSVDVLRMPMLVATFLVAESTTLVRYVVNDRWVFKEQHLSWKRLWQFHAGNAGGFLVWWTLANLLPLVGVHYLIASTLGVGCSMVSTIVAHFLWIWRKSLDSPPVGGGEPQQDAAVGAGSEARNARRASSRA